MKHSKATKVIKVALPILALAASVRLYLYDYFHTRNSFLVPGVLIACYLVIIVLYGIETLMEVDLFTAKQREKASLEAEAQPVVAPELDKVKGNWYKKELVRRRLVREYVESHSSDSDKYRQKQANIDSLGKWTMVAVTCSMILTVPLWLICAAKLIWLVLLYVPFFLICPASFKRHKVESL